MFCKKLLGDRLYLSPKEVNEDIIDRYTEWMNDFDVTDYIGRSHFVFTRELERDWLNTSVKDNNNRLFDIIDLETNKLIGTTSLENIDWVTRSAVLGIFIGDKEFRDKGYGTETIKLLLEYGFRYLNLHSIRLDLLGFNERAHNCYLKCGFKDIGKTRDAIFLNGKYYDKYHMDILESEFEGDFIRNKNIK